MEPVDIFLNAARQLETHVLNPLVGPVERQMTRWLSANLPGNMWQKWLDWLASNRSPLSLQMPLMNQFHVVALVLFYFAVVFGGMFVMNTIVRRRLDVKVLANVHNAFLVWLSAYMCYNVLYQAFVVRKYSLFDNQHETNKAALPLAKHVWLFYFSKIFEFVDTFIMVAKMNFRQVSFLHLYHHSSIFAIWWYVAYVAPTGEAYFSAALNSFIHVVMYSYYLCSSLGILKSVMSFIKPFITLGQMTQFSLMMVQATYDLIVLEFFTPASEVKNKYPRHLLWLLWLYMWTMLGLFANFFFKNYTKKTPKSSASKKNL